MFRSATLKLTAWYLAILMSISLIFSVVIYVVNFQEVSLRLQNLQQGLIGATTVIPTLNTTISTTPSLLQTQSDLAAIQMVRTLVYINLGILVGGGVGGYFLARRTLRPIERILEAQGRFTSDASHELRTPLAAMKAEAEVALRQKTITEEEAREIIESNLDEVNKLIQLSDMLLNLSRLDYGKLKKAPVDIVPLIYDALKPFAKSKKRFKITTRKQAKIYANEPAIVELMTILIDNALKYSPKKSEISIRVFERMLMVGFEITNSGPIIPQDKVARLFDRFYRGDTSRTNSSKNGYGLGLSIAKKIVDVHEGDIQARSTANGTTFTFFIPAARYHQGRPEKPTGVS